MIFSYLFGILRFHVAARCEATKVDPAEHLLMKNVDLSNEIDAGSQKNIRIVHSIIIV